MKRSSADIPATLRRWRMPVRISLLVTLMALMMLLWGRLLLKEVPRSAVAEPKSAMPQITATPEP